MSLCGKSQVVLNTSQRQPPPLRRCPTRCPAQRLKHPFIAAMDISEIHGQVPGSAIEDRTKFSSQSLRSVVIEMTPQDHPGIPGSTPHGDNCQLRPMFHCAPRRHSLVSAARVRGSVSHRLSEARYPPIDTHRVRTGC
jgi:hypothetical protein